ncbi:MAG: hypothetical protein AB7W28_03415, partial [Armatimonadota bacterium]
LSVEYAELLQNARAQDDFYSCHSREGIDPSALLVMLDLWKAPKWFLTGMYADVDGGYDVFYSTLNPYYEVLTTNFANLGPGFIPWERWTRNVPIFSNVETIGGTLGFQIGSVPFEISYYSLDSRDRQCATGRKLELAYDALWSVRLSKELANGVTASVIYAHEDANDAAMAPGYTWEDADLLAAGVVVGF